jgi:hypothetical protein
MASLQSQVPVAGTHIRSAAHWHWFGMLDINCGGGQSTHALVVSFSK